MVAYSFIFFLLVFVLIGVSSSFKSKKTNEDYLIAKNSISPWLAALSAIATNNSGYMFIGMIGFTYTSGLQSIWLMVGWILGDLIIGSFVFKGIRGVTEKNDILSYGGLISRWHGTEFKKLRFLVGLITVIFLGVYAAAQFKAGSKALHVLFGWDYSTGAIIGSVIVFLYCLSGGIRASIWTDAAQSIVMIFAMTMLFVVGVSNVGGFSEYISQLDAVAPGFLSVRPTGLLMDNSIGIMLFILGWIFAGFGVVGQPHIMVRFMTLDDVKNINKTRAYYYIWYIAFYTITIGVGLTARLILPETSTFDAELALPMISQKLLPEILIGVVLAGIFSATMSTADSQILSCSAAFTKDLIPKWQNNLFVTKLTTGLVTVSALLIALFGSKNVFELVLLSWSILSVAFTPIITLYTFNKRVNEKTGIAMVLIAIAVSLIWKQAGLSGAVYEVAPGIIAGFIVYFLFTKFNLNKTEKSLNN